MFLCNKINNPLALKPFDPNHFLFIYSKFLFKNEKAATTVVSNLLALLDPL